MVHGPRAVRTRGNSGGEGHPRGGVSAGGATDPRMTQPLILPGCPPFVAAQQRHCPFLGTTHHACPHSMACWVDDDDDLDRRIEEVRRQIREVEAGKASMRSVCLRSRGMPTPGRSFRRPAIRRVPPRCTSWSGQAAGHGCAIHLAPSHTAPTLSSGHAPAGAAVAGRVGVRPNRRSASHSGLRGRVPLRGPVRRH